MLSVTNLAGFGGGAAGGGGGGPPATSRQVTVSAGVLGGSVFLHTTDVRQETVAPAVYVHET